MTLWDQMLIVYDVLGFVAFLATLAIGMKYKWKIEINNVYAFFFIFSAIWLFEYYFIGEFSYIPMDEEGDHFIPFYAYLSEVHLGGQFGHHLGGGIDVFSMLSSGNQLFPADKILQQIFPLWIAILVHKFIVVAVGFAGTYLLCRDGIKSDKTTAALVAAFFTLSNKNLVYITYSLGIGLAFLPLGIWVIAVRAKERTYYPFVALYALAVSPFLFPAWAVLPVFAGIVLGAVLLRRINARVVVSLLMLAAVFFVMWGEVLYSMVQIAPLTERGSALADKDITVRQVVVDAGNLFLDVSDARLYLIGAVVLSFLWAWGDRLRVWGTLAILGPVLFYGVLKLFPWETVGLETVKGLSHHYVRLAVTGVVPPLLAQAMMGWRQRNAEKDPSRVYLPSLVALSVVVGMVVYFKAFNVANLLYHGGQGQYHTADNVIKRDWRPDDPFRVITLRVRDLGPESGLANGFYGLEAFDTFSSLPPRQYSDFYRLGFGQEASQFFVDWSAWKNGRYHIAERISLPHLRVANVGFILSPIPLQAEGLEPVASPDAPPMLKKELFNRPLAYLRDRVSRLFDVNDLYIYALNDPLPRAYAAKAVTAVANGVDDGAFLQEVVSLSPGRTAVVRSSDAAALGPPQTSLRVLDVAMVPDGYRVRVDAPDGGIVVLNTPFMPFWKAFADERPLTVVSANFIHLAVAVPPGAHSIDFTYHRPTLAEALSGLISSSSGS